MMWVPVVGAVVTFLGVRFEFTAWDIVGYVGQVLFFSRFLFQWLASERRGHSYVPVYFWWLSLAGALVLLVYLLGLKHPPFPIILGQVFGFVVYTRNLVLIRRKRRLDAAAALEPGDTLYAHAGTARGEAGGEPADKRSDDADTPGR